MTKGILARIAFVACALFALPALRAVGAEDYPNRPVTIVVPFPPGASTDILGRYEADVLGRALHGSFVVENKPGAGGEIGIAYAAKAAADGYQLVDPAGGDVGLGPLISATQRERVRGYIRQGIDEGATLVTGGAESPDGLEAAPQVEPLRLSADEDRDRLELARERVAPERVEAVDGDAAPHHVEVRVRLAQGGGAVPPTSRGCRRHGTHPLQRACQ